MEEDPNASQVLEVAPPALTAVGRNARNGMSDDADLRFFLDGNWVGYAFIRYTHECVFYAVVKQEI